MLFIRAAIKVPLSSPIGLCGAYRLLCNTALTCMRESSL